MVTDLLFSCRTDTPASPKTLKFRARLPCYLLSVQKEGVAYWRGYSILLAVLNLFRPSGEERNNPWCILCDWPTLPNSSQHAGTPHLSSSQVISRSKGMYNSFSWIIFSKWRTPSFGKLTDLLFPAYKVNASNRCLQFLAAEILGWVGLQGRDFSALFEPCNNFSLMVALCSRACSHSWN